MYCHVFFGPQCTFRLVMQPIGLHNAKCNKWSEIGQCKYSNQFIQNHRNAGLVNAKMLRKRPQNVTDNSETMQNYNECCLLHLLRSHLFSVEKNLLLRINVVSLILKVSSGAYKMLRSTTFKLTLYRTI